MHAAEDDELRFGMLRDLAREAERIAGVVGELDHLVALIVMAEDDQPAAERRLRRGDAAIELFVGQTEISLGKRLALRDMRLLELRQDRQQRRHLNYSIIAVLPAGLTGPRMQAGLLATATTTL